MSAVGPLAAPPPRNGSSRDSTGYGPSAHKHDAHDDGGRETGRTSQRALPHIVDLATRAERRIDIHATLGRLLQLADDSARQADALLEYRRPDLAYVEYLTASEIVINVIPRHKDAPLLQLERGRLDHLYKDLIRRINSQHERFASIKDIIVHDNKRSGVTPTSTSRTSLDRSQRPLTPAEPPPNELLTSRVTRFSLPRRPLSGSFSEADHTFAYSHRISSSTSAASYGADTRPSAIAETSSSSLKPSPYPKPERLRDGFSSSSAIGNANVYPDALTERFARLKVPASSTDANGYANGPEAQSSYVTAGSAPLRMPSPADYAVSKDISVSSHNYHTSAAVSERLGPSGSSASTGDAGGLPHAPPHPPKIPIDTAAAAAFPKPPSPTYSPARNLPTPASIRPPRTTARSVVGTGGRTNSVPAPSSSARSSNADDDIGPSGARAMNGRSAGAPPRRKSVHLPRETCISAEKLYDYLRLHNVLVIDVRSREDFDQGHIFTSSIMCVEPAALRRDMSAEDLQDSLVLAPEPEQYMFDKRDQYDLVVYYDQSTNATSYLSGPTRNASQLALRMLFDSLYEYNQEKPLQRPPILLQGGLNAWADLMGSSALIQSSTSSTVSSRIVRAPRPVGRIMTVNKMSSSYIQKRPLRDYNPLDPEEERKWLEKARVESVMFEPQSTSGDMDNAMAVENASPIYRNYEDFLRRFPEATALEQQSMIAPPSRPAPTLGYDTANVPDVPSRPPPALPRVSYSGVHDRSVQASTHQSRSSHLAAYTPPSHLPHNLRLPRTGLVNFGVTCYMNATIQCLSATTELTAFFLHDAFLSRVQKDNWKGSKGLMPQLYANLIKSLWKGDVEAIRPTSFRNFCARLNREWGLDQQQDAKEFLEFLLDCLHEDLNSEWARSPLRALSAEEEAIREGMPRHVVARKEWNRYQHRERSFVSELFAGQHASRLRCTTCLHTSTTYEAFYSISVEIPRTGTGDIRSCLRSYCAEERLSGDEVWKCPHCKKEREATKRIIITRAPRFLVVHLKRFSAGHAESARKVRTPIEFPLQGLDLEPYMLPSPTTEELHHAAKVYGPENIKTEPSMTPPYVYDAYAVMRHVGTTLTSGHYIGLVKDTARGCWKQYNDHRVDDFDPNRLSDRDRLQNEQAYIVFYQRVPVT